MIEEIIMIEELVIVIAESSLLDVIVFVKPVEPDRKVGCR